MTWRWKLIGIGAVAAALGMAGWIALEPALPRPRNVILISLDTLRADHLGLYGYSRPTSRNLDAFARESFVFERALAVAPNTPPSQMSMMTSLYPGRHGFTGNGDRLDDRFPTLAEQFQALGWLTAGFVDGGYLRARFGFDRGFQIYNDAGGGIARVFHRALRWLEANAHRPFFLFLHCYDIHAPYISPPPFGGSLHARPYRGSFVPTTANMEKVFLRKIELSEEDMAHVMASYDEGIRYTDSHLGEFLSYLREKGLLENTAVIITSDHGEEFGEHGSVLHWQLYFRPNLHVPLLVRIPGAIGTPVRIPDQVQLIDLLPTILDLIGAPPLEGAQGTSFLGVMSRSASAWQRRLHRAIQRFREAPASFAWWPDPGKLGLRSVVKGSYQLVFDESREGHDSLFDIGVDPLAQNDVAGREPEVARSLRALGLEVMRANRPPPAAAERSELDEETRRQLEALGYGQ